MGPTISVRGLTLFRNQKRVLTDVSLDIGAGEVVCLLGPSGSGKSSLLRCLNRLTEPPAGTTFMNGEDLTTMDILALRRHLGMVFQQVWLMPGTVAENVAYGAQLQKRALSTAEVHRLLAMVDLPANIADKDSQTLSGGQAQRVAIARVLATEPSALLLDEPTSALDPTAMKRVEETMLKLRQTLGLTIIWVTHDPEQARRVADRVYLLVAGRIVDQGRPEHLFQANSDHLAAAFAAGELDQSND